MQTNGHNDPNDPEPHVHGESFVFGPFSGPLPESALKEAIRSAIERVALQHSGMDAAVRAGRVAMEVVYNDEYARLHELANGYDAMRQSPELTPTDCARALVTHSLAQKLAQVMAKLATNNERQSELAAQRYEHRAATERWQFKLGELLFAQFSKGDKPSS